MAETQTDGLDVLETREWIDSLDYVLSRGGAERAGRLLQQLSLHARRAAGVNLPFTATTPYQNTIASRQQPPFPGSQEMERRIKAQWPDSEKSAAAHYVIDNSGSLEQTESQVRDVFVKLNAEAEVNRVNV